MRLIDADTTWNILEHSGWENNADRDIAENIVLDAPTVDAIPIDKLCEWLTEIDMPLADACPLIDKYYHVCTQCDFFQRPIKECWKEILSKLMEEQNEAH